MHRERAGRQLLQFLSRSCVFLESWRREGGAMRHGKRESAVGNGSFLGKGSADSLFLVGQMPKLFFHGSKVA